MWSSRHVYDNPSIRNTGVDGSTSGAQLGVDTQKENTTQAPPQQSLTTVIAPIPSTTDFFSIIHDAVNNGGQFVMQQVDDTGTLVPNSPQVKLTMTDLYNVFFNASETPSAVKWYPWTLPGGTVIPIATTQAVTVGTGGVNYRGTYSSSTSYSVGDVVRVQTGTSQGVWICVLDNPTSSHPPTFPEPVTIGGTNYWEMLAFGVTTVNVCISGTGYNLPVNAGQP
jgi:hypothetical protein